MKQALTSSATNSDAQRGTMFVLVLLLALLTYFPLLSTGFTTNDDLVIASNWQAISPLRYAKEQGRIGFFIGTPLLVAPYLFDNPIYYDVARFAGPLLLLLAMYLLLRGVYRSASIGTLAVVLFLAFVQNNWNHNALTSYPLLINVLAVAFIASVASYIRYLQNGGYYGWLAAALYFVSLSGEHFVLFFPVFVAITAVIEYERKAANGNVQWLGAVARKVLPIAMALFAYLACYVAWRIAFPSQYAGNIPSAGGLSKTLNVIWTYSMSAFPGFEGLIARQHGNLLMSFGHAGYDLRTFLSELRVEWIVKAAVVFYAVWLILKQPIERVRPAYLWLGLAISLACVFLPNILLSLTEKYRTWVDIGSTSFVHTYYSYIAIIFFFTLFLAWLSGRLQPTPLACRALAVVVAFLAAGVSLATDFNNFYVTQDQRLSELKWEVVNRFMETKEFEQLPPNTTILAPSLFEARGIVAIHPSYWTEYFSRKSGKKVSVTPDAASARAAFPDRVVYLKYLQEPRSDNQILIYAPIADAARLKGSGIRSDCFVVYSYGRNRKANLIGMLANRDASEPVVSVAGSMVDNTAGGVFAAPIDMSQQSSDFPSVPVQANVDIELDNLVVSYYAALPLLAHYTVELGDGFFGWEGVDTPHKWSWSKGNASLTIANRGGTPAPARISMKVATLCPRQVTVSAGTVKQTIMLRAGEGQTILIDAMLPVGSSALTMTTNAPACSPGTGDPRLLGFSVSELSVRRRVKPADLPRPLQRP